MNLENFILENFILNFFY